MAARKSGIPVKTVQTWMKRFPAGSVARLLAEAEAEAEAAR
jgi:hypothetical protein